MGLLVRSRCPHPLPEKSALNNQLTSGEAPVRFRFGYGLGMERFKRFRFSVLAVPLQKGFFFSVFQCSLPGKDGSGFGSWKTVPAVPVPLSVSGKTVPTVPVSGSGSVLEATL